MYERFGARDENGCGRFEIYFPGQDEYVRGGDPHISSIQVYGDFQEPLGSHAWSLKGALKLKPEPHGKGTLYSCTTDPLPKGFYQYKYVITFKNGERRIVGDPCTRYCIGTTKNPAFVIGAEESDVQPLADRRFIGDLVIYELMIDDFTFEYRGRKSPVEAVIDRLDYIADLGFNAIEFMPWTAWPGRQFSWGYNPFLFFSVEQQYIASGGEPVDGMVRLQRLISECHARGIHVIMDCVLNHAATNRPGQGFPYFWLYQDAEDCPFVGEFAGGSYHDDMDFHNECVHEFIMDVLKYWIDRFSIDGVRIDYTMGIYKPDITEQGLPRLIADLRQYLHEKQFDKFSITLEHIDGYNAIGVTNKVDADSCWLDDFYWIPRTSLIEGRVRPEVMRMLNSGMDFHQGKVPTTYIENHDHARAVSIAGGRTHWFRTQPWVIALMTCAGAVLVHNGQEFGEDYSMPEPSEESPHQRRVVPRPKRWTAHACDAIGRQLTELYRKLIRIRMEHPAFRGKNFHPFLWDSWRTQADENGYGVDVESGIVIYHRWNETDRYIIVLNFANEPRTVSIPFSNDGAWSDLLNGDELVVSGNRVDGHEISGNWGCVFHHRLDVSQLENQE